MVRIDECSDVYIFCYTDSVILRRKSWTRAHRRVEENEVEVLPSSPAMISAILQKLEAL